MNFPDTGSHPGDLPFAGLVAFEATARLGSVSRAADALPGPPGTSTMSGEGVSSKACVAPIASTPESATTGPGSCATKRMSAPGSPRSTS